jgi:hypothetical protein
VSAILGWSRCGCTATTALAAGALPAPAIALLAVIDGVARAAAASALDAPGRPAPTELAPTAVAVRYQGPACGELTATATVPCDGDLADRADAGGVVRFSVAVEVTGDDGRRVATATVQWRARLPGASRARTLAGDATWGPHDG